MKKKSTNRHDNLFILKLRTGVIIYPTLSCNPNICRIRALEYLKSYNYSQWHHQGAKIIRCHLRSEPKISEKLILDRVNSKARTE